MCINIFPTWLKIMANNKEIALLENSYKGSGIKHPNMSEILSLQIPIPPLSVQTRIVEILDKFSNLIDSANQGIPKEIELRKKQYEYYLNKLLAFKEK